MSLPVQNDIVSTNRLAASTLRRIRCAHIAKLPPVKGMTSGLKDLDRVIRGFHPGDLVVLSSRPRLGSTALALQIATHNALRARTPVLIFSMSVWKEPLMQRLIAAESQSSLMGIRTGFFAPRIWLKLSKVAMKLSKASIAVVDTPGLTVADAAAIAQRHAASLGMRNQRLGLIIVDDLDSLHDPKTSRYTADQLLALATDWKKTAQNLKVPVIVTARHTAFADSGQVDQHGPSMNDSLQSAALARVADVLIYVHRDPNRHPDSYEPEENVELICKKTTRHGFESRIEATFDPNCARFSNRR